MDGKQILDAAIYCKTAKGRYDCRMCPIGGDVATGCGMSDKMVDSIIAVRDYILDDLKEWIEDAWINYEDKRELKYALVDKLDSMKGGSNE